MRVLIVLPAPVSTPTGGYKVQFQHANYLASCGWDVGVGFLRSNDDVSVQRRLLLAYEHRRRTLRPSWFELDERVRLGYLTRRSLHAADVVVATAASTIRAVAGRRPDAVAIVYDYEFWVTAPAPLRAWFEATFRLLDGRLIVTSPSVERMLDQIGCRAMGEIGTGIDTRVFRPDAGIEARRDGVLFPYREGPEKGLVDAIAAVALVRERLPGVPISAYGSSFGRRVLPEWIGYVSEPSDAQLADAWRGASVALTASRAEGFGLPGLEAMACGAALATTDAGGNSSYAVDGETALVVEPMHPARLATAAVALLTDADLRERLTTKGVHVAAGFGVHAVGERLDSLLRTVRPASAGPAC